MTGKIKRSPTTEIEARLAHNPVVALLGPHQCGKTSLAGHIIKGIGKVDDSASLP